MSTKPLLNFKDVEKILEDAELYTNVSETHGVISGLICGGVSLDNQNWLTHFNDVVNEGMGLPVKVKKLVQSLFGQVVSQIADDGIGFTLLLPDDEVPLDERAEAMGQWAQGFLVGFGMVQQALNESSDEIKDLIRDIRDISQVSLDFEQEDEESELAFTEIVGYLSVGAMICFNTFSRRPNAPTSKTVH